MVFVGALIVLLALVSIACQLLLLRRPIAHATDVAPLLARLEALERALGSGLERVDRSQREELAAGRRETREEMERVRGLVDEKLRSVLEQSTLNRRELREDFERVRGVLDGKLTEVRRTVDEKLQETLDKRLTESFQRVSERLEQVYKGLGEMQALAIEVGDVKRALSNVRARGTWGEVQAGALLEEVLSPELFGRNVVLT